MRIQLDSSALAYLIENSDEDFKLELQSAVVQQFVNKYLKSLVTVDIVAEAKKDIDLISKAALAEVSTMIKQEFGTIKKDFYSGKVSIVDFDDGVLAQIRQIVVEQKQEIFDTVIKDYIESRFVKIVTEEYKTQIKELVRQEILRELRNKLM